MSDNQFFIAGILGFVILVAIVVAGQDIWDSVDQQNAYLSRIVTQNNRMLNALDDIRSTDSDMSDALYCQTWPDDSSCN